MANVTLSSIKGRTKKQQVFTSSGTFVPSAGLLASGGFVEVFLVNGGSGGGGGGSTGFTLGSPGGQTTFNAPLLTSEIIELSTLYGGSGGRGIGGSITLEIPPGPGGGRGGNAGQPGSAGTPNTGGGGGIGFGDPSNALNTTPENRKGIGGTIFQGTATVTGPVNVVIGAGGDGGTSTLWQPGGAGGSGICIVTWEE